MLALAKQIAGDGRTRLRWGEASKRFSLINNTTAVNVTKPRRGSVYDVELEPVKEVEAVK